MSRQLLVVDDDPDMCELIQSLLSARGYEVTSSTNAEEALRLIDTRVFDVVLTDMRLGDIDGLTVCEKAIKTVPGLPVVVFSGYQDTDTAASAARAGAFDLVAKPTNTEELQTTLLATIERALAQRANQSAAPPASPPMEHPAEDGVLKQASSGNGESVHASTEFIADSPALTALVGESPAMQRVRELVRRIADTDSNVLLTGETGTGKEVVARALHAVSSRAKAPFVALDCAAVPETLFESELFGHEKGAFTDARTARKGLLVQANGGTIFLDELGEMPRTMQPKLLRALQERRVRPVGADHEVPFECRIISATNRNLETEIETGNFRRDLYYRLNVVTIHLPPLRERGKDILLLAQNFLEQIRERSRKTVHSISDDAEQRLIEYPWPGNVRELYNSIERAVAFTRDQVIDVEDLPDRIRRAQAPYEAPQVEDAPVLASLEEVERRHIERVLHAVDGNKAKAAKVLRVNRTTLYRKLRRYHMLDKYV